MQLDKTRLICETFEYVWVVEGDMNVKLDIQLNLWQYWISATVERDENVKRDQTIEYVTVLICGTAEWDYTVEWIRQVNLWNFWICLGCWRRWKCKRDQTIEFVTLLNLWNYEWDMSVKLEKTCEFANCSINGTVE